MFQIHLTGMRALYLLSLLLLCLIKVDCFNEVVSNLRVASHDCDDPLACYLYSLVVNLPDFEADGITFYGMVLKHIVIERLPSNYIEPNILDIGVTNLGATITGKYKKGLLAGPMAAKLSRTSFNTQLAFNKTIYTDTAYTVPNGIAYVPNTCHFDSIHISITLTTKLPHPGADAALKSVIKNLVCITLGDILATNVTQDIQTSLDPRLVSIMESSPSIVPNSVIEFAQSNDSVHWTSTLFGPVHRMITNIAKTKFFTCFLADHTDITYPYIDSIINNIIDYATDNTGVLVIDLERLNPITADGEEHPFAYVVKEEEEEEEEEDNSLCTSLGWNTASPFLSCTPSGLPTIDLSAVSVNVGLNVSLTPLQLVIGGLDTFSHLQLAQTNDDDPALLSSSVHMDVLEFNFTALVEYGSNDKKYNDTITLQFTSRNVTMVIDGVIALYKDPLEAYTLAQSLSPYCLAQVVEYLNVTNMHIVSHITTFQLHELADDEPLEEDAMLLIDNILRLFIDGMPNFVTELVTGLSQGVIRKSINSLFTTAIAELVKEDESQSVCAAIPGREHHWGFIKWPTSTLLADIDAFINTYVGYSGINSMANCLTDNTGTFSLKSFFLPFFGNISLELSGLNSFYSFDILEPSTDTSNSANALYGLHSALGMGYCDPSTQLNVDGGACSALEIIINFGGSSSSSSEMVRRLLGHTTKDDNRSLKSLSSLFLQESSDYSVALSMMNMSVSLQSLLEVNMDTLIDMTIADLETRGCVEGSIDIATLDTLDLDVAEIEAILISPGSNSTIDLTDQITAILPSLDALLLGLVNDQISNTLSDDNEMCANGGSMPASHGVSDNDLDAQIAWEWQLGLISIGSILLLVVYALSHRYLDKQKRGRDPKGDHTLLSSDDNNNSSIQREGQPTSDPYWDALSLSPKFNVWNRLFYPLAIIATIYLFIFSNMSPNPVTVYADITVNGATHDPIEIFKFTLGGTVKDMWNAEVYVLATLIAFFSGGWPYVKLVVMLAAWVLPSHIFNKAQRGHLLKFVDAYGKWSLVDFFVMCLFLCAFHFDLQLSDEPQIEILMRVAPSWGFYSFLLATLLSLGLGHMTVLFHRLDVGEIDTAGLNGVGSKETMKDHVYILEDPPLLLLQACRETLDRDVTVGFASRTTALANTVTKSNTDDDTTDECKDKRVSQGTDSYLLSIDHEDDSTSTIQSPILAVEVAVTERGRLCMIGLCFLSIMFTLCSVLINSFYFKFLGLTGYLLKDTASSVYSVMSVATEMVIDSGIPNDIAMRWMQANFILFTAVMPLFAAALWLTVWNMKAISISVHKSIILLGEVIYAWSALDVFAVSIIASMLEIKQFAMFMVGDKCDAINAVLAQYFDEQLHHDDKCFDVETTLSAYSAFLFFAPVFVMLVVLPNLLMGERALEERIDRARIEAELGVVSRERSKHGSAQDIKSGSALKHTTALNNTTPSGSADTEGEDLESDLNKPLLIQNCDVDIPYMALLKHKERYAINNGMPLPITATSTRSNNTTITTPSSSTRPGESKSEERGSDVIVPKKEKEACCSTLIGTVMYCKCRCQSWLIEKSFQMGMLKVIRPIKSMESS